jgi:uncharacterized protein
VISDSEQPRRGVLLFLALSLGFSICYWVQLHYWPKGSLPSVIEWILWGIFRDFGPAIAAIITLAWERGRTGLKELGSSITRWRVSWRLHILALVGAVALNAIAAAVAFLFFNVPFSIGQLQPGRMVLVFFLMAIVDGPLGEEIGWRGYLLPRLLERTTAIRASLLVGFIWYVWHLPLYAADGRDFSPQFLSLYLVNTTNLAIIFTWFFLRTSKSIFFAIYLHAISNYFNFFSRNLFPPLADTLVDNVIYLIAIVLLGILAVISLVRYEPSRK